MDNTIRSENGCQENKPKKVTSGTVCGLIRDLRGLGAARKAVLFGIEVGLSARQVRTHIRALEIAGLIRTERGGSPRGLARTANRYFINMPLLWKKAAESKQTTTEVSSSRLRKPTSDDYGSPLPS